MSFGSRTQQIGSGHRSNQPSTLFWTVASSELLLKTTKPKILPLLCPTFCLERVTDQHQKENVPCCGEAPLIPSNDNSHSSVKVAEKMLPMRRKTANSKPSERSGDSGVAVGTGRQQGQSQWHCRLRENTTVN